MEAVDTYLLSRIAGEPRVVCLPTAAGREAPERIAYWSNLGIKHLSRLGVACESVEVVDRSTAQSKPLALQIAEANFVYPSGGDAVYLYRTLLGTETWTAIEQVLEKGGVVAGCSAGAMIWGERIPSAKPPPWAWESGFNSIPGSAIIPHFDEVPRWAAGDLQSGQLLTTAFHRYRRQHRACSFQWPASYCRDERRDVLGCRCKEKVRGRSAGTRKRTLSSAWLRDGHMKRTSGADSSGLWSRMGAPDYGWFHPLCIPSSESGEIRRPSSFW